MNTYLSTDKLPQALREKEKHRRELQRVADEPALAQDDLSLLHQRVRAIAHHSHHSHTISSNFNPLHPLLCRSKRSLWSAMLFSKRKCHVVKVGTTNWRSSVNRLHTPHHC